MDYNGEKITFAFTDIEIMFYKIFFFQQGLTKREDIYNVANDFYFK